MADNMFQNLRRNSAPKPFLEHIKSAKMDLNVPFRDSDFMVEL